MYTQENIEFLHNHIERYIGPVSNIFKEIVSDHVSIDVLVVAPTPQRNYYTLITCGMSEFPMTVPAGAEEYRYAELMISLPPTWKLSDEDFKDERNYWPIRALKKAARFPHDYNTWLYLGHTVTNGNPAQPYCDTAKFQSMLIWVPEVENVSDFFYFNISDDKEVRFYNLVPLYKEELDFTMKNGGEALINKLNKIGATEVVNISRKNSCKKVFGFL
ncbi:Suppressor of fused protein (SUFU) [compost metagenome]|uniref:Ankyrin n=1 Tax=Paenibacillus stellifer TaxID=169760 RepID=A0A089LUX1_9BACL|nr:suppressor of fused domain protein [Paenibacillus stellifer]AIQ63033.1 ankyrin [Paenibacillus stellifer]